MTIAISLLTFLLLTIAQAQPTLGQDESVIAKKMSVLAGKDAHVCGLVRQGESLKNGWQCAKSQDSKRSPFWLAVAGHSVDSQVWHIIARSVSGKRYVVFYSSNDSGEPGFEPSFTITECREPFRLTKASLFVLRCGKDVP
jgi:hypothetical protein